MLCAVRSWAHLRQDSSTKFFPPGIHFPHTISYVSYVHLPLTTLLCPHKTPAHSLLDDWSGELCVSEIVVFEGAELVIVSPVSFKAVDPLKLFERIMCNGSLCDGEGENV